MSRPSSPQSSAAPDADSTTYPATCQARHVLGSKATPQTHCNSVRLYSSRYSVSLCARKPMLMCPWQLSSRQPSCRCLQIEGRMSLRQQLLTSEAARHCGIWDIGIGQRIKYCWMQLAHHHSAVLVAILLQCCILLCRCCAVQRTSSWRTSRCMGNGSTAGVHTALQQL